MRFRAFSLALILTVVAGNLSAHPLHTSFAELSYDQRAKEIRVSVRVFVDDLTKASSAYAASHPKNPEAPILAYARANFQIVDAHGRVFPLVSCGSRQVNDLMWLCFRASSPKGVSGLRVTHRILFDLYSDEVNIVQATLNGRRLNVLFTRGDGFKRLD